MSLTNSLVGRGVGSGGGHDMLPEEIYNLMGNPEEPSLIGEEELTGSATPAASHPALEYSLLDIGDLLAASTLTKVGSLPKPQISKPLRSNKRPVESNERPAHPTSSG